MKQTTSSDPTTPTETTDIAADTESGAGSFESLPTVRFVTPLPGFPGLSTFRLVAITEASPVFRLVSLEEPAIEFAVAASEVFFPDYEVEVDDDTAGRLGISTADDAVVLVVLNLSGGAAAATANLRGPIVANRHSGAAEQLVLEGDHDVRRPLFEPQ